MSPQVSDTMHAGLIKESKVKPYFIPSAGLYVNEPAIEVSSQTVKSKVHGNNFLFSTAFSKEKRIDESPPLSSTPRGVVPSDVILSGRNWCFKFFVDLGVSMWAARKNSPPPMIGTITFPVFPIDSLSASSL